ncbi:girdin-like [Olea europaea var. sylvestris]|uniref:girdin-like n=1 Tax=Olea europaea var. sylvestris TaxID=158386 RepID=UPI000C1D1EB3|nr:girdin-like [Olea europaea var. sylvestris]
MPPYFDGSNYAYWKVRIRAFLKSLDEHVWVSVQNGWKPSSTTVSSVVNLTDISLWTKEELAYYNWNSKGLHALFMVVSPEKFRRVLMCETAKEAWDILETTHEGTKIIKNSKLQMLTSKFEEIRMKDDKSFDEFYAKLNDIVNSSFNLGEKILESKIVRKILRSLPERFRPKVTSIEESKDLDTVNIEELVGSLQIYELTISQPKKNKSIALNTVGEEESESSDIETLRDEEIAYFVKKLQKALKGKRWSQDKNRGVPSKFQKEKSDKPTARKSSKKSQVVRCHECQGLGHYRNECPNFKKNLKKGRSKALAVSLTDDDSNSIKSESDKDGEKVEEDVESEKCSDDIEDETDIHEVYQLLIKENLKIKKVNKALFKKVDELEREKERLTNDLQVSSKNLSELKYVNEKLEDKVKTLSCELEKSNIQLQSFMSGTKKLDDQLGMNKPTGNRQRLGFVKSDSNVTSASKTTFLLGFGFCMEREPAKNYIYTSKAYRKVEPPGIKREIQEAAAATIIFGKNIRVLEDKTPWFLNPLRNGFSHWGIERGS